MATLLEYLFIYLYHILYCRTRANTTFVLKSLYDFRPLCWFNIFEALTPALTVINHPNRALATTLLKHWAPQLRAVVPPLQLQPGITQAEKAESIRAFITTHWDRLGPHIDLSIRAWNIDQYRSLFGVNLGEGIFVFNQEQDQIPVVANRQTIPNMLPQPVAPPGRGTQLNHRER